MSNNIIGYTGTKSLIAAPSAAVPRDESSILAALGARFHPDELETNYQGHLYVGVDPTLDRLHEVCGSDWAWNHVVTQMTGVAPTSSDKTQYGFWCHGTLEIQIDGMWIRRDGSGADINVEPDTSAKAAQAYALRKAGNYFNIARYLAKEKERDIVGWQRAYLRDPDIKHLKAIASHDFEQNNPGVGVSAESVASYLGLSQKELQSEDTLLAAIRLKGFVF